MGSIAADEVGRRRAERRELAFRLMETMALAGIEVRIAQRRGRFYPWLVTAEAADGRLVATGQAETADRAVLDAAREWEAGRERWELTDAGQAMAAANAWRGAR